MIKTSFFFISSTEIVFILFVVLLIFGADKIPLIAKGMGKGIRNLKKATNDIKGEIKRSVESHGIDTDITQNISEEIDKVKEQMEDLTGSIRRK